MIGPNSEHEEFCQPRSSFEAPESRRIAMKVRRRLPPNSTSEVPGRPLLRRKLVAPSVELDRTQLGQSLSLDQMGEPGDIAGVQESTSGFLVVFGPGDGTGALSLFAKRSVRP